ncbi:DEP domain-containing protein DDB_G0279099 [Anastrepha ludens]|uniref:DEP domain-containing protein DDB_G0279099 n=1 Tax=Anastrepha ludens TaxID=28586 RepID=UPI0023AF4129|nr:DEP domain-containing protein DDB_G0279099 [Anastrepha ludens]XP_053961700.1 DEP domain-containing protein DDB_G0279099 [Anastrepha ludens]XP_053961701.1 DEP domain-containing protein DDB_G0279099 [Anastrepha ludens]XP_053961702.1 DEP domain-containing protein DDB_G0279099 [Anastrepha ludens]
MLISNDFTAAHSEKISKSSSGSSSFSTTMATSKSSNSSSETQPSSNSNKNIENSLIKHQGQKWHQYFDFDKLLKQIRVAEKHHHRYKGDSSSSNNGKNVSSNSSAPPSKSGTSTSRGGRSLRQVQRLNGNDMHYYGIVPKKTSADVIVCSICRGIYTMVGFNNHMMMQHPAAWGAASSKLSNAPTTSDIYSLIPNDNSQDCIRDGSGSTAPTEILGSPSDLSGIMSTSSNASSSSSSVSTTSSTYTAKPRHKSSKSSGTTAGSSSSGRSSSTSGSRSRSKQSRHNSSNNHAASVGIHTPNTTNSENTQAPRKSSKKTAHTSGSKTNKNENVSNTPAVVTSALVTTSSAVANSSKHSKDPTTGMLDATVTTPIALYSSSSNSSCSLPPTPKLTTHLPEVKSPAFVAQEFADSSVSSSSSEYERTSSSGKAVSSKSSLIANTTTTKAITSSSCSIPVVKEVAKASAVKEISRFDSTQLSELDQAVSSITECPAVEGKSDKKMGGSMKNVVDSTTNLTATSNNIFHMPSTTAVTENHNEKLHQPIANTAPNNMNVVQAAMPPNYVVPQEMVQACEDGLPHNTSDDNSILTFDDVFDSKFINEILSTADTEIHFDENELDTAAVAQQQQQQEQHEVYQQQQVTPAKRMRYDETILESVPQQQLQHQQQGQGVEITGEFVTYQQQQQYVPYNVATLEDLKMFNGSGPLVEQHQQISTHLQHAAEQQQQQQQQQQLTAIDAMQLQQLLYQQQQTLNTHYDSSMVDDSSDPNHLALQQQQYDQTGVVSAKHLIDMCATVDIKSNKLGDFSTMSSAGSFASGYDNMAAHFQLYNVPSLTDDNVETAEHVPNGGEPGILMPNIVNGMQRASQQYVLPGGTGEDHLIYEITDNNQVAVISQHRQQQMLTEFLTRANYDQVTTDMNATANAPNIDATNEVGSLLQQSNNGNNMPMREASDENDEDLFEFDYSLLETVKTINNSNSGVSGSSGGNSKPIKTEPGSSASSNSKYYEDVYLNAYLYAGIPKPIAINCFGLIKLPFAAATTFRKHILNARKANNSPITLSGGGINGIVCSNPSAAARLSNNSKSMQNYFSNLTSSSNSLVSNEFSIGSITITNSSVSQSQLYAAQQKHQNAGSNNSGTGSGCVEITFNTNSNGCGPAMSPVSSMQRSRSKSGNSSAGSGGSTGGATLVRSKSQTGAPVAVVTPTSRLPPPPRPSTAGPVLAQSSKTIFVNNTPAIGNDRVKLIKRCMPLVNSSNSNSRNDGGKRQKFSPRQIADFLGGVNHNNNNNNKSSSNHKSMSGQQCADIGTNGGNNNHEAIINNNASINNTTSTNSDEQLKLDRVAHFYERRRKLYDLARNTRQQQQQQQQQRTQPLQMQQKLLKQQQQLFKMLTDYGQLNTAVGNCKGANATANPSGTNGSEVLRISV